MGKICLYCTVKAPVFGTLNSAISNIQTWFVRTVMEVLIYCWMLETSNMQCNHNSLIQIINFHGLFRNRLRCRKLVPAEYWCPYGTNFDFNRKSMWVCGVCVSTIAPRNWHISHLWNSLGHWMFHCLSKKAWNLHPRNGINFYGLYAVKAQTSLAPLSWFPGSRIPTAHVHQCCRFQSYAKSRRLHAVAHEIDKRNLQTVNHIPGIHDNGPPVTSDFNSVLLIQNIWEKVRQ